MTSIVCIGVVIALGGFVIVLKTYTGQPKKAQKWEKADIMKQLLALSEGESVVPANAPARSRTPRAIPGTRPGKFPRQPTSRVSHPAPSHQGRC
jgi:hypothetical protein